MARRVSIGKNGVASPFIVSIDGVDAFGASNFSQIIFDANQRPLRLREISYVAWVAPPAYGAGVSALRGSTQYSFGGLYPMIFAAGKAQGGEIGCPYITIANPRSAPPANFRQFGMGLMATSDGWIYGVNFSEIYSTGPSTVTPPPVIMYYALLQNAG